ncbi:MAG: cysteine synthase family protein [Bacteroidia bacterium]|nr:MAG: cysteine synthase family protein [Bacteroidia bacterium]
MKLDQDTPNRLKTRVDKIRPMIGNTPMLAINYLYKGRKRVIYAKAENMNMTGSIKDRIAFHIIKSSYNLGILKPGDPIFEATSGNTGIAFSAVGKALGHPVTIFMPDWMSSERINLIRSLGATINLVTKEQGGFLGSIEMADRMADSTPRGFLPHQFSNKFNTEAHYSTTGPEIYWQLKVRGIEINAFVAGVGTGGTVMGVGNFLREINPSAKIHPLEPSNSPTMSTGSKVGKHRIQGISDEFIPPIVDLGKLDRIVDVDDGDSIIMAQKLASQLGLGVGISSGANFIGAVQLQNELGDDAVIVTIFSDDNKKYLSTDLMRSEDQKEGFLSKDIDLIDFDAFKRTCNTCCDPEFCVEKDYKIEDELYHLHHCAARLDTRCMEC